MALNSGKILCIVCLRFFCVFYFSCVLPRCTFLLYQPRNKPRMGISTCPHTPKCASWRVGHVWTHRPPKRPPETEETSILTLRGHQNTKMTTPDSGTEKCIPMRAMCVWGFKAHLSRSTGLKKSPRNSKTRQLFLFFVFLFLCAQVPILVCLLGVQVPILLQA